MADLVVARTAAAMTQQEGAVRMRTTKRTVLRREGDRLVRPTLNTIERYALAIGGEVEICVRVR